MAMRQRVFQIYTRPSIVVKPPNIKEPPITVILGNKTTLYMTNPINNIQQPVPKPENSDEGFWIKVFETTSYEVVRSRLKQLLPTVPMDKIKLAEKVFIDTDIVPEV